MLDDAQAKTGAAILAGTALVHTVKAFKNVRQVLRGNARPVVTNLDFDARRSIPTEAPCMDFDLGAGRCVNPGVGKEILKDLGEFGAVHVANTHLSGDVVANGVPGGRMRRHVLDKIIANKRGNGRGLGMKGGRGRLKAGKIEQIGDEGVEPDAVPLDGVEKLESVGGEGIGFSRVFMKVDKGFGAALDQAKGRTQLMGNIRNKFLAKGLQAFVGGNVVQDVKRPGKRVRSGRVAVRGDGGTSDLDPIGSGARR